MSLSLNEVFRLALKLDVDERRKLADYLTSPPPPLSAEDILQMLNEHSQEISAFGVDQIGLFGSHVRGEAGSASDIDLLVTLKQTSFTGFIRLKHYLEELFGRPVDLVTADSIRSELRQQIMDEVVYAQSI